MLAANNVMKLKTFVDLEKLSHKNSFKDDVFSLLGESLVEWIDHLLRQFQVLENPKILSSSVSPRSEISGRVYIEEGCVIEPFSYIKGPCFIGKGTEVRQGAYIRGNCYIGKNCVVGHTTEVKDSVFFDGAKAGHFAYVGNSILGRDVNLGAGTKLANLKLNQKIVSYKDPVTDEIVSSGLKKFGSIIGDYCQTGCNSVLSPGSLLLPGSFILPCTHFRGTLKGQGL